MAALSLDLPCLIVGLADRLLAPLYQHLLLTAEKKFWRCVESGEPPRLFGVEPPRARIEAVRIVDMSASNAWAEFSSVFRRTREAHLEQIRAATGVPRVRPRAVGSASSHVYTTTCTRAPRER
jgi:hypothetical protein